MALATLFMTATAISQTTNIREVHRVKKKETIFGIARQYGLTIQELINANPEMNKPGYELKKDSYIIIPFAATTQQPAATVAQPQQQQQQQLTTPVTNKLPEQVATARDNTIRMGVMLPLHDINGDGRRMVEYYRGVLMACDSLRKLGYSIDVHAWNTPDNQDIAPVLRDKAARQCDFIIGPDME